MFKVAVAFLLTIFGVDSAWAGAPESRNSNNKYVVADSKYFAMVSQ
jgi:hypothetical protein